MTCSSRSSDVGRLPFHWWPAIPLLVLLSWPPSRAHGQRSPADSVEHLVQAANHAYREGSRESLEQGLELLQQAIPQLRTMNNGSAEGNALNYIGVIYRLLDRPDSALVYYMRAIPILDQAGDGPGEGAALDNIGQLYQGLGRPDSAHAY
jgi:tetratricopeptide (TPR) repeat protein